jgi:hypothetical protein
MEKHIEKLTGIFIPAEILAIKELTDSERIILSHIWGCRCNIHDGCCHSNTELGALASRKEPYGARSLTKFRSLKLIEDVKTGGTGRVIRVTSQECWLIM